MRRWLVLYLSLAACGDDGSSMTGGDGGLDGRPDGPPSNCQPQGATGQFNRRANNPRLLPKQTFADGKLDTHIADPDVRWDAATSRWELYYASSHGTSYTSADQANVIRHGSSADRITWAVDEAPALVVSTDPQAWDRLRAEAPTVVYNPAAPADRSYLMLYSGASGVFPHAGYSFNYAIGAAISADGKTFTRITAAESPKGKAGLVLTAADVFPAGVDGVVADPELVLVNGTYHLFFSSFSCTGTDCNTVDSYGISHATSTDGIHWVIAEAPVRSLLRASADLKTGGAQPSVIYDEAHCRWEMWLSSDLPNETANQPVAFNNMAGVWHADSLDGITWHVNYVFARELVWTPTEKGEPLGLLTGADVGSSGNGRLMLYVGFDNQNVPAGFTLPDRTPTGSRPGVTVMNVATRDLP
ncbi:MAG: hypothetical protein H0T46_29935 [Deltaproteobacteria bacterium]|nr:hypothetical protein [Deltaproteobacteria bacterium]